MANEDGVFLLAGAYASVEDARTDYEAVKELHEAKELRVLDRADTEQQISALMSGQGA